MTKTFCDKCGAEALSPTQSVSEKIGERTRFQLRAIFETVQQPAPCGSVGLASDRTSPADICRECQLKLINSLRLQIINTGVSQ